MDALKYTFAICGTVLCASVIIFLVEWRAQIVKVSQRVKEVVSGVLTRWVEGSQKVCKDFGMSIARKIARI